MSRSHRGVCVWCTMVHWSFQLYFLQWLPRSFEGKYELRERVWTKSTYSPDGAGLHGTITNGFHHQVDPGCNLVAAKPTKYLLYRSRNTNPFRQLSSFVVATVSVNTSDGTRWHHLTNSSRLTLGYGCGFFCGRRSKHLDLISSPLFSRTMLVDVHLEPGRENKEREKPRDCAVYSWWH